jgi:hypothetical protein
MAKILNKVWKEQRKREPGTLTKEQRKRMDTLSHAKYKQIKEKLLKLRDKKKNFIDKFTKQADARRKAKLGRK